MKDAKMQAGKQSAQKKAVQRKTRLKAEKNGYRQGDFPGTAFRSKTGAVMMQESGGKGKDPMQSSQSPYNQKYPRKSNGIPDPKYSIACGVRALKAALTEAEAENPLDLEHIRLALQGYNFGNGYISWAKNTYGGYTAANAAEFSEMMAEKRGLESCGDRQYAPHVLQYYAFGRVPAGTGNQAIVQMALAQEGNSGDVCKRRSYPIGDGRIYGYGTPAY